MRRKLLPLLEEFAVRTLCALYTMAVRNPRTTAAGIACAVGFIAARRGFDLSPDQLESLALGIILFLGLIAGDSLRRHYR